MRYLLWLLLFYVIWRIFRNTKVKVTYHKGPQRPPQQRHQQRQSEPSLSNIQDAEFEDITPPSEENK